MRKNCAYMTNNLEGEVHRPGRIEVVCGSMFSGKTEELIRRLKRAKFARQRVEIFNALKYSNQASTLDTLMKRWSAMTRTPFSPLPSTLLPAFSCWPVTSMWWVSTRRNSWMKDSFRYATNWPIAGFVSSWPDSTWISAVFLSAPYLPSVPLPMK